MDMRAITGSKDTFETYIKHFLRNHGLWENEIEAVFVRLQEVMSDSMENRWKDSVNGYPAATLASIVSSAKHIALKWLDENAPEHFSRYLLGAPNSMNGVVT